MYGLIYFLPSTIIALIIGILIGRKIVGNFAEPEVKKEPPVLPPIYVNAPSDPRVEELFRLIKDMPGKVLESITSSTNSQKGKLGELVGYLHLNSKYDRLIALRDITDFVGIRFPKNGELGTIDFIDVKNGPHARLNKDQVQLKTLISEGRVGFYSFKIETSADQGHTSTEP